MTCHADQVLGQHLLNGVVRDAKLCSDGLLLGTRCDLGQNLNLNRGALDLAHGVLLTVVHFVYFSCFAHVYYLCAGLQTYVLVCKV